MRTSSRRGALIVGGLLVVAIFFEIGAIWNGALDEPAPRAVLPLLVGMAMLVVVSAVFAARPSKALGIGALALLWLLTCGVSFTLGSGALQELLGRRDSNAPDQETKDPINRVEEILTSDYLELELETFVLEPGVGISQVEVVVEIRERAVLNLAIAVDPLLHEIAEGTARFVLEVEDQTARRVLGDWRLRVGAEGEAGWRRLTVDMADFGGETIRLRLRKLFSGNGDRQLLEPLDLQEADLLHWSSFEWTWSGSVNPPSIVLVSIDTLRADHLGFMGHERATSPRLDRLAREGTVFETCISQAPWTLPAHAAIMTGLYPHSSGSLVTIQSRSKALQLPVWTISEILAKSGFETVAFTGRGPISARYGLRRGFQYYSESILDDRSSDVQAVVAKARTWLAERKNNAPFFLFLHTFEPHSPYTDEQFLGEKDNRKDGESDSVWEEILRYDGDIHVADEHIGRFLEDLLENQPDTLVVVTSDHGEEFLEGSGRSIPTRSESHGHSLFDEQLHVPLLMLGLGERYRGLRVGEQVRSIDIAPTLLDAVGVESPSPMEGRSLLRWLESGRQELPALSEGTTFGANLVSMRFQGYKLIERLSYGTMLDSCCRNDPLPPRVALYDLSADKGETRNLATSRGEAVRFLRKALEAEDPRMGRAAGREAPDSNRVSDVEDSLRALGYLE